MDDIASLIQALTWLDAWLRVHPTAAVVVAWLLRASVAASVIIFAVAHTKPSKAWADRHPRLFGFVLLCRDLAPYVSRAWVTFATLRSTPVARMLVARFFGVELEALAETTPAPAEDAALAAASPSTTPSGPPPARDTDHDPAPLAVDQEGGDWPSPLSDPLPPALEPAPDTTPTGELPRPRYAPGAPNPRRG